ncbi:SIR2 family NAD-dependent protein deacylase [Solitalea koreensis]|uniref:NAD-dependent protein deacylase n=1 Tax=Solitalea koreensis TaxID=543615 RepID=A0A521BD10_9SPHI|nr:NAD-dependent deacylase [Solitalea koreensis]SMO44985.1 NAD-dependent deacetylase [Solitalea koreensis]
MKKIVILTGAGISAESGLKTFRDSDGLWEGYDINEVATPDGWRRNPDLVQQFYNLRRKAVLDAQPNAAHRALAKLDQYFETVIVTQNIDNLHEQAGSKNIVHLHGIITKSQSSLDPNLVYDIKGYEIKMGEKCEKGSQLRPHVVWFGEPVPMIEVAMLHCTEADIFMIIGTSLAVYPAAGLIDFAPMDIPKFLVDPNAPSVSSVRNLITVREKASIGVPLLVDELIQQKA